MANIQSPCNGMCRIDKPSGWCLGCGRTLDEIALWPTASDALRQHIRKALPDRMVTLRHHSAKNPKTAKIGID